MPTFRLDEKLTTAYKERAKVERLTDKALVEKALWHYLSAPPPDQVKSSVFVYREDFDRLKEEFDCLVEAVECLRSERLTKDLCSCQSTLPLSG